MVTKKTKTAQAIVTWLLALILFLPVIATASGYDSSRFSIPEGGTGSSIGAGLFGGYGLGTDTSGTVTLTSTSARTRNFNNGASTLTYALPDASDVGPITYILNHSGTSSSGDLTLDPASGDAIGTTAVDTNFVTTITMTTGYTLAIKSDGINRWNFVIPPNQMNAATNGVVESISSGIFRNTTSPSTLTSAPGLTTASVLVTVGALSSGSIASGFGSIANSSSITAGTTLTATSGAITATAGNLVATNGNLRLETSGNHIAIETGGAAPMMGTVTLSAGTADFNTTAVATGDLVWLQRVSGTAAEFGHLTYTISNGSKVVVNSSDAQDDSVVNVLVIRPL